MSVESSRKPFNRDTMLPSSQAMSQVVTRVIAMMMMGSSVLFALYLVVEFLQTGDVRELFVIRFTGTVVLITCTFIWIRARNAYRNGLSGMAGLVFITTISICTTLATYYGDERFHIAMAYGFVIAVFNILLWRSMSSFILGVVGALAAPMTLMFAQHPSSDDLIDYLSLTVITVALSFMVFIIQQRVVAEIVNLNSELIAEAGRDDLTGLMNRRGWAERVTEWEQAHPNAASSLLYMDIDRFKYLNDRFGHDIGDQALIDFAGVLKQSLPEHALVARFGGDEFVVFLPGQPSDAFALSETLKKAARESDLAQLDVAISVGIATTREGSNREELLREADHAMLQTKIRV